MHMGFAAKKEVFSIRVIVPKQCSVQAAESD